MVTKADREQAVMDFGRGESTQLKARLVYVNGSKEPRLDVRQFIKTETFEGFTRKGIRLELHEVEALARKLAEQGLIEP